MRMSDDEDRLTTEILADLEALVHEQGWTIGEVSLAARRAATILQSHVTLKEG